MSLFEPISRAFAEGHARAIPDLLSDAQFARDGRATPAAVLIAITDVPHDPQVILTQRPRAMRDHPGQVAFPGGKIDPGEDAVTAALREAEEELALPRSAVRVIGSSDREQGPRLVSRPPANTNSSVRAPGWAREVLSSCSPLRAQSARAGATIAVLESAVGSAYREASAG